VPLAVGTLVLITGGQIWLYVLERPPTPKRAWDSSRPPYPGLEAFIEQDAGVFFGREPQIVDLLDRLHPTLPDQAHRFVTVIGPSGAGKSSLVQAGLIPRLARQRSRWIIPPPLVPGTQPIHNLARSLTAVLPNTQVDTLVAELAMGPAALVRYAEQLRAASGARSVLLVIDQTEELLTRTGEQERAAFLALLRAALQQDPRLWVVATLRSEFLTGLLTTGFADLFQNPLVVGSLDRAALFEVIEEPAAQAGLTFAPGVVNRLVNDTGGGDALPLLAYTLQALYLRVGPGGTITAEDYRQLGGVAGALSRQADRVAAELQAGDTGASMLPTLLKFVTVDETQPTRRRVRRSTLNDEERRVVDAFITARLLTSDATDDDTVIEVAHEALFRQWPLLRQAIEARADDLRQRAELERWAQDWVRSGHRGLLPASRRAAGNRPAVGRCPAWSRGRAAAGLRVPSPLEPLRLRHLGATIRGGGTASAGKREPRPRRHPARTGAIEECAPTGWLIKHSCPRWQRVVYAASYAATSTGSGGVAWSPDGRRIATASSDRTVRVWDVEDRAEVAVLSGHEDWVWAVAWSPDGRRIATASFDRTIRVWDVEDRAEVAVLRGHTNWVRGVAWSPDGRRVATASTTVPRGYGMPRTAPKWQ
jgi:hypothetical protein